MSWEINVDEAPKADLDALLRVELEATEFAEDEPQAEAQARKALDAAYELSRVVGGPETLITVELSGAAVDGKPGNVTVSLIGAVPADEAKAPAAAGTTSKK